MNIDIKPLIGVLPLWDEEKNSLWMLPNYLEAVQFAGGVPVIFPFSTEKGDIERLVNLCNGILLTGGQDVSPSVYNMEDETGKTIPSERRDSLELEVLKLALEKDMPVLGICRGLQFLNAVLGGTLYQDIPLQYPEGLQHRQGKPYDSPVHKVYLGHFPDNLQADKSLEPLRNSGIYSHSLKNLLGREVMEVNSLHHQAIRELAPALSVTAVSEDGLIEGVEMKGREHIWALQWHPEFLFRKDSASQTIFRSFVESCKHGKDQSSLRR